MNKTDSNTNIVPIYKIFEIRKFYDKYYTEYCSSFGPKIKLLFDLNVGTAYEKAMEMKTIDDNTIEFEGNALSIIEMYDKLMNYPGFKIECSMSREEFIPQLVQDPIQRFIMEKGTCIIKDTSKYKVQFHKIN